MDKDLQMIIDNLPDYVDIDLTYYSFEIKHGVTFCIHYKNGDTECHQAIKFDADKYQPLFDATSRDYSPEEGFKLFSEHIHSQIIKFDELKNLI